MDLNRNFISVIRNTTFAGLPNLLSLDIGYNNVSVIEPNAFFNLTNLVSLKLPHNAIIDVKRIYFNGLVSIQEILMAGNKLTSVEEGAFQDMKNLTILTLDVYCDCNIQPFWNWLNLARMYELTVKCIDLDDAFLTTLPSCFFDKCNGPQCSKIVCNQNMCYYNYTGEVICQNEQDIKCTGKYIGLLFKSFIITSCCVSMDNYSFKELCQNSIYQTRKTNFKTIQMCPIVV
ncbi:uncharacterized protein LOC143043394 [Mytilus galloprovincialis]|uniref:uncharacterized protein LOC143043394 n=1 Tax=Mytilus galloprovincialis TaxID=29158 RepID=UPI003F7C9991